MLQRTLPAGFIAPCLPSKTDKLVASCVPLPKLDRPLPTKDGGTLRTIREACDYMTAMGKERELRQRWQRVAKLILAKENVLTVSRALELALFMDAKLDVSKVPAG